MLHDLRRRLADTRYAWPESGDWALGTPTSYLRELVDHWQAAFDWRAVEDGLNAMPQFTVALDDARLHFVHARGKGPAPVALLFIHGWPGSFWEVHKILGPLTDPAAHGGDPADAFDVVAPSIPGYCFSSHPGTPGWSPARIGDLFDEVMTALLGYESYGVQGGDWGAVIGTSLGREHSASVKGIHLNFNVVRPVLDESAPPLTDEERRFMQDIDAWRAAETGYAQLMATKPQTAAQGVADSPAGLAAWIVEKFRAWSDCAGDLESVFSKDELLTNVMLYWVTGCMGSAMRLYYERTRDTARNPSRPGYVHTPTGYVSFPKEIWCPPRSWLERTYNLQRFTAADRGGHFPALEQPDLLVADIRSFFRELR